jgi:hypothetical protein
LLSPDAKGIVVRVLRVCRSSVGLMELHKLARVGLAFF